MVGRSRRGPAAGGIAVPGRGHWAGGVAGELQRDVTDSEGTPNQGPQKRQKVGGGNQAWPNERASAIVQVARPGLGYSDLAEVVADFCRGTFKITLLYNDNGITMAAAFLQILHAAKCVANVVYLSGDHRRKFPADQSYEWTSDAQRKFKILLVNVSHEIIDRLLQPLSPLKAQIGALCHLDLPENSTLEKFVAPLVPFRSLSCCRALNIGFRLSDVPRSLIAVEQRAAGDAALMLYAATESRIACTHCGLMQRNKDSFDYLPSLSGAHIIVSAINNTPYVVVQKRGPDGKFKSVMGVEISLLEAISQRLNFTYSLSLDSVEYGALKNDSWTGLIGNVLYRKSHLALSEISFTRQRTEVISYLYPVLYDVLSYATRAPTVIPFAMAIIKPFSEDIWALLVLSVVLSTAFLFCLRWSPATRARHHTPDFWFLLSTLSRQNPWEEEHASAGYRVFLGPWWLFVTVLTTLYSGRLVAIMSVAVHDTWINNLDALEKALAKREARVCTHSRTIFIEYIKVATSGSFYQVRVNQLEGDSRGTVLVNDRKTGLERALYHKYVYVDSRLSLLTGLAQVGEHKAPLLRVVKDHLGVEYCGFVFQKGCPLQHTFTNRSSSRRPTEKAASAMVGSRHVEPNRASIAAALTSVGVSRTKDQVHTKIENLTHTYRKCLKEKTTGSSPPNWTFFVKIQKFLGSLPVNDPSLKEEAGISLSPASSSPSVEELISGIVAGSSSDDTEVDAPEFTQASSAPQQPSNIQDCVIGRRNSSSDSGDGVRRKRRKYTGAEIKEKMLNEQRLLREQFEAAHKEEMEIRTKALKLQEKLVDAMVDF
ncbi:hypothetical protein MRX96_018120 [Rhipicephalus microplus]